MTAAAADYLSGSLAWSGVGLLAGYLLGRVEVNLRRKDRF